MKYTKISKILIIFFSILNGILLTNCTNNDKNDNNNRPIKSIETDPIETHSRNASFNTIKDDLKDYPDAFTYINDKVDSSLIGSSYVIAVRNIIQNKPSNNFNSSNIIDILKRCPTIQHIKLINTMSALELMLIFSHDAPTLNSKIIELYIYLIRKFKLYTETSFKLSLCNNNYEEEQLEILCKIQNNYVFKKLGNVDSKGMSIDILNNLALIPSDNDFTKESLDKLDQIIQEIIEGKNYSVEEITNRIKDNSTNPKNNSTKRIEKIEETPITLNQIPSCIIDFQCNKKNLDMIISKAKKLGVELTPEFASLINKDEDLASEEEREITRHLYEVYQNGVEGKLNTEKFHDKTKVFLMQFFYDLDFNTKTGKGYSNYSERTFKETIKQWNDRGITPAIVLGNEIQQTLNGDDSIEYDIIYFDDIFDKTLKPLLSKYIKEESLKTFVANMSTIYEETKNLSETRNNNKKEEDFKGFTKDFIFKETLNKTRRYGYVDLLRIMVLHYFALDENNKFIEYADWTHNPSREVLDQVKIDDVLFGTTACTGLFEDHGAKQENGCLLYKHINGTLKDETSDKYKLFIYFYMAAMQTLEILMQENLKINDQPRKYLNEIISDQSVIENKSELLTSIYNSYDKKNYFVSCLIDKHDNAPLYGLNLSLFDAFQKNTENIKEIIPLANFTRKSGHS